MGSAGQYLELTITVQDMQRIRAETTTGQTVFGQVDLPPLHQRLVQVFEHWLGMDKIEREEDLEVLGNLLFQILFNGEIFRLYDDLHRQASKGLRLRVQLSFQGEAFDIASYPWEFLHVPETPPDLGDSVRRTRHEGAASRVRRTPVHLQRGIEAMEPQAHRRR